MFEKKRQTASGSGNPGGSSAAPQPLGEDVCSEPFGILHVMQVEKMELGASFGGGRKEKKKAERPSCSQHSTQESGMLWVRTTQASLQFIIL